MKITKHFILNLKIFTGCFFILIFIYHVFMAILFPTNMKVDQLDTNDDSNYDYLRIYRNHVLYKELLDQTYSGVYDFRIFRNNDGSIDKISRMIDLGVWFTEYYEKSVPVIHEGHQFSEQHLNINKTFTKNKSVEREQFPFYDKRLYIRDGKLKFSYFYRKNAIYPFVIAVHDENGRFSRSFRDDDGDGKMDIIVFYEDGKFKNSAQCYLEQPISFSKLHDCNGEQTK